MACRPRTAEVGSRSWQELPFVILILWGVPQARAPSGGQRRRGFR